MRQKNWIRIMTPEGKDKIAHPDNVKKLMGLDITNYRLNELERRIEKLESPMRQEKIIEALRDQGKHNRIWLENRVLFRWYDLGTLIKKGIIDESQSGTQRMIELSDTKEPPK